MKKSELEQMLQRAEELSADADPQTEMMGMMVKICGEILLQSGDIRRSIPDIIPKINSIAMAVSDLEAKISGKLAVTRYDFGETDD